MNGKELGIVPIKPNNHFFDQSLDNMLGLINKELFFFTFLPYNQVVSDYMRNTIRECGKAISALDINDKGQNRKEEILQELRKYYKTLIQYTPEESDDDKTCRYMVAMFLKDKDKPSDKEKLYLEWLPKTKKFSKFYKVNKTFADINQECINFFKIKQ